MTERDSIIDSAPYLDDPPPSDYAIERMKQMRKDGATFFEARRAVLAEMGRFPGE